MKHLLKDGGVRHIAIFFGIYYLILQLAGSDWVANAEYMDEGLESIPYAINTMLFSFSEVGTVLHIIGGFFLAAACGFIFEMVIDRKAHPNEGIIMNSGFSKIDILYGIIGAMTAGLLFHLLGNNFFMLFVSVMLICAAYLDRKYNWLARHTS